MVRIELHIELNYQIDMQGADFVFNIHAANTPCQVISREKLILSQSVIPRIYIDPATDSRFMTLRAEPGELKVSYAATVDLMHYFAEPRQLNEVPIHCLPPQVMSYIYPSRYCQSDRLLNLANNEFGNLPHGYSRVQFIQDWVQGHVTFISNTSNSTTSAIDTLMNKVGVCRDFAHLMIALCRALNIPARFATGTDYGSDPAMGAPDFQAYVEVYLGDRWYLFDPTGTVIPMGLVRFGTGRDAADVAFATIFGGVTSRAPIVRAVAVENLSQNIVLPYRCNKALSTTSKLVM